jgi:hypothetical protein
MPDQNERDAVVAPAKVGGKRPSAALPKLNLCGDIGLKIGRDGTSGSNRTAAFTS